ncbi:MAG: MFS transporter [Clostridiales bacterium]|nr:MFS transporter [Clostridiales bacterium]
MTSQEAKSKVSLKFMLAWPTRTISMGIMSTFLIYVSFYATDYMKLPAASVGIVFLLSKIFDGVTDIIAGVVIDKTNSRLGKGRPYELALIGVWVFMVLMFSAPQMGVNAGLVYLFVMYSIINSVFMTLLNCNEAVYLSNALEDKSKSVSILAVTGIISLVFTIAANIMVPQLINGMDESGMTWTGISLMLAIPFTLIGIIRFLVIKEVKKSEQSSSQKLKVKELLYLLAHNKYIVIISALILFGNMGTSMNVGSYYFQYIMGDLGLASLGSLGMMSIIAVMIAVPSMSKKLGMRRSFQIFMLIGALGHLIRLIDVKSVPLMLISSVLAGVTFAGFYVFVAAFCIECMDYGEWKHKKRSEGMITSAQSVMAKLGSAFGLGIAGILLGISGYDGTLAVQSDSANGMIIFLNTVFPCILGLIMVVIFQFYDLDKKIVNIRAELALKAGAQ